MLIIDKIKGQYIIFNDGWHDSKRDYGCICHIEVKDNGRIWLRHDGTDIEIGQKLLDKGVEKSDLVIGFHSPQMREWSDFAIA
ncbi:MAG: XisI protein [Saprospiraceae bacterium]|nr:XisI protein [Saprospiraceae bacterium]